MSTIWTLEECPSPPLSPHGSLQGPVESSSPLGRRRGSVEGATSAEEPLRMRVSIRDDLLSPPEQPACARSVVFSYADPDVLRAAKLEALEMTIWRKVLEHRASFSPSDPDPHALSTERSGLDPERAEAERLADLAVATARARVPGNAEQLKSLVIPPSISAKGEEVSGSGQFILAGAPHQFHHLPGASPQGEAAAAADGGEAATTPAFHAADVRLSDPAQAAAARRRNGGHVNGGGGAAVGGRRKKAPPPDPHLAELGSGMLTYVPAKCERPADALKEAFVPQTQAMLEARTEYESVKPRRPSSAPLRRYTSAGSASLAARLGVAAAAAGAAEREAAATGLPLRHDEKWADVPVASVKETDLHAQYRERAQRYTAQAMADAQRPPPPPAPAADDRDGPRRASGGAEAPASSSQARASKAIRTGRPASPGNAKERAGKGGSGGGGPVAGAAAGAPEEGGSGKAGPAAHAGDGGGGEGPAGPTAGRKKGVTVMEPGQDATAGEASAAGAAPKQRRSGAAAGPLPGGGGGTRASAMRKQAAAVAGPDGSPSPHEALQQPAKAPTRTRSGKLLAGASRRSTGGGGSAAAEHASGAATDTAGPHGGQPRAPGARAKSPRKAAGAPANVYEAWSAAAAASAAAEPSRPGRPASASLSAASANPASGRGGGGAAAATAARGGTGPLRATASESWGRARTEQERPAHPSPHRRPASATNRPASPPPRPASAASTGRPASPPSRPASASATGRPASPTRRPASATYRPASAASTGRPASAASTGRPSAARPSWAYPRPASERPADTFDAVARVVYQPVAPELRRQLQSRPGSAVYTSKTGHPVRGNARSAATAAERATPPPLIPVPSDHWATRSTNFPAPADRELLQQRILDGLARLHTADSGGGGGRGGGGGGGSGALSAPMTSLSSAGSAGGRGGGGGAAAASRRRTGGGGGGVAAAMSAREAMASLAAMQVGGSLGEAAAAAAERAGTPRSRPQSATYQRQRPPSAGGAAGPRPEPRASWVVQHSATGWVYDPEMEPPPLDIYMSKVSGID